jgi:hypothetical protein
VTRRPPRLATALLRRFGPQDDVLAGDLLEGFQRRSSSKLWYWWQVAIALRITLVRELQTRAVAIGVSIAAGWTAWIALDYVVFTLLDRIARAISVWRVGYEAAYFGPFYPFVIGVFPNAIELIGAVVAVHFYRGHRPMMALLYAAAVLAWWIGRLTLNSVYYDPTQSASHYGVTFPPIELIAYLVAAPSFAALCGGLWAASSQPRAALAGGGGHVMGDLVKCAVCGQSIEPNESRIVDAANGGKVHVHVECKGNR